MTRRLVVAALACSLVLSGCLGGSAGAPETTTVSETTPATETTTAETPTTDAATTEVATTRTTESAPRHRTYETPEALAANASFSVPDPEVPSRFAFESGIVMELADSEYVAVAYHDAENGSLENVLSVRKAENESAYDLSAGNATTLGDRDARYVAEDSGGKFLWECDGYVYRVSVQQFTDEFGEAELRAVAESVACE